MQPTLISLRGRILAMRIALIVIAGLALPGAVRSAVGCLGAAAPAPVARWRVVTPARAARGEVARLKLRARVRREVAAELRATRVPWRSTHQLQGTSSPSPSAPVATAWEVVTRGATSPVR